MPTLQDVSLRLTWLNVGWPLLVSLVVALSATGIGLALLRAAVRGRNLTGFEAALAPALGLAVMGYVADLIFMTGGVNMRPIYRVEVLAGLGLFVWHVWKARLTREPAPRAPWIDRIMWTAGWAVVLFFAGKLIIGNSTPVSDGDSFYHYGLYSQSLSAGVTFNEILLLKNFPLADLNRVVEHVYAAAGTLGGVGSLHLMNFLFIAGIALIAQAICAGALRACRWANPLPVLAVLSVRELVYTGYSAKLDYGVALFELLALALWLTWRDRRLWILVVGLGVALCARSNTLRFIAVLPLLWFVDQWWHRREDGNARTIIVRTAAVCFGVVLVAAPPYAMQQFIYGNPFFPIFNGIFGHYQHYYEWNLLGTIRYKTDYAWAGPFAVWIHMALQGLWELPGVRIPPNTSFGLSALMLLTPLAIWRDRRIFWLLGFVVLGYLTWFYGQAHTHRTLVSVAAMAAVLGAIAINRLRRRIPVLYFSLFIGVAGLAGWSAADFLTFNSLALDYFYAYGGWTKVDYNDVFMKALFPNRILPAADLDQIYAIVGDSHIAATNLAPFSDPRLIRTKRLAISGMSMAAIAADEKAEAVDRRVARETLESKYLNQQAKDLEARLWPENGVQRPLAGSADLRWYLTASYDAMQFIGDDILADPGRLPPLLRFEGVKYLLAPKTSVYGTQSIAGLTEVWHSDIAVLFRVN